MVKLALVFSALTLGGTALSLAGEHYYQADALLQQPGTAQQSGTFYVGEGVRRFDYVQKGQRFSRISLTARRLVLLLNHGAKQYIEIAIPAGRPTATTRPKVPCKPSARLGCIRGGDEKVGEILAQRWTITPKGSQKPIRILWDPVRKMPLAQELPNGMKSKNVLIGREKYEGIDVERWERTFTLPNGRSRKGLMLYAPSLRASLVDNQPGGIKRELKNIKLGRPDAKLFEVPAGYVKVEAGSRRLPAGRGSAAGQ